MISSRHRVILSMIFFFNDTATTEIYTLSLHDALPICPVGTGGRQQGAVGAERHVVHRAAVAGQQHAERLSRDGVPQPHRPVRSEEHTSELQSRQYLVFRLLLEKKK